MLSKILPSNENTADRAVRIGLGLGLLSLVFVGPQTPWGYLGLILVFTGIVGSCPIYTALGFSTCSLRETE